MAFKDPVSGLSHLVSAVVAVGGLAALLVVCPREPWHIMALAIYGASLVLLFLASAVFHLVQGRPAAEAALLRMDHSAIYLLIAGTYTPFCLLVLPRPVGIALLVAVWALAVAGIVSKVFFFDRIPRWLSTTLYVLMGWLVVFCIVPLIRSLPLGGVLWVVAGGVLYTCGVAFFSMKKLVIVPNLVGHHEIWHLFVTAGAAAHYVAVLKYVAMG